MSTWQLVIVTGSGDTATSSTGTSTFFTAAEGDSAVQQRGTASYVVSGTHFYRVGWPGQGPGKVAAVYEFNRILTETEMNGILHPCLNPAFLKKWKVYILKIITLVVFPITLKNGMLFRNSLKETSSSPPRPLPRAAFPPHEHPVTPRSLPRAAGGAAGMGFFQTILKSACLFFKNTGKHLSM